MLILNVNSFLLYFSVKKQPEHDYDYINLSKPAVYETVNPPPLNKPVTMDKNPAYRSTVLADKKSDHYSPEYEIIDLQPAAPKTDNVKMEKNPAYAETQFK